MATGFVEEESECVALLPAPALVKKKNIKNIKNSVTVKEGFGLVKETFGGCDELALGVPAIAFRP